MAKRSVTPLLGGALVKLLELPAGRLGGLFGSFLERAGAVGAYAAASELSGGSAPLVLAAAVALWGIDGLKKQNSAEEAARRRREDARKAERILRRLESVADDVHSMHELLLELVRNEQATPEAVSAEELQRVVAALDAAERARTDEVHSHLDEIDGRLAAGFDDMLSSLADKNDVAEILRGIERMHGRIDEVLDAFERAAPRETSATLDDYLPRVARETRSLLIERFRIGDRGIEDTALEQRLLGETYVELDVDHRRPLRSHLAAMADRVEEALVRGVGSGDHDVVWMPPEYPYRPHRIADVLGFGAGRYFEVLPIGVSSPPRVAWSTAFVEDDDLNGAADKAAERQRLALLVHGHELPDPLGSAWAAFVHRIRERWPGARVLAALERSTISLEHLLALDPALHGLPGRYVLRGHPGTGKTTVLRHAALSAATRGLDMPGSASVPVLVSLPAWSRNRVSLEDLVACEHPELAGDLRAALFDADGDRLLLLFDGLDELPSPDARGWIDERLRDAATRWPSARIVVATRKIGYRALPAAPPGREGVAATFAEVDLVPLDRERQQKLLHGWLVHGGRASDPAALAERILRDLDEGGAAFDEMREVPLLLTFVAMLYEDAEHDPSFRLGRTRTALYAGILEHLVQGRHRRDTRTMQPAAGSRRALQRLAERCTVRDGEEPTRADLESALLSWWDAPDLADVRATWRIEGEHPRPDASGFLTELAAVTGILQGRERDDARWSFWHRTLREALVAQRFAALVRTEAGRKEVLARAHGLAGHETLWAEPFALFVGLTDEGEADGWVLELAERNHALALRALASVEGVKAETIETILRLDGLDQEARCAQYGEVYAKLGEQADAAPAAAKLLGRLAAQTDDCLDLWHLARALDELERSEPGAADDVGRARSRLFEHESFGPRVDPDGIGTPGHPGHAYWRDVPAGTTFWMGSDEEEGRREDERPRHQVRIERAFQIAAVPVTNALWARFRKGFDADAAPGGPEAPVTDVSWYDAAMFCAWLGARLTSEAEWECACRAGTTKRFWSGDADADLARVGWFADNADRRLHTVGELPGNPFGLFDVHGNMLEWCQDRWHENYDGAPEDGSAWEEGGSVFRVARGGSFRDPARRARSAYRFHWRPGYRGGDLGFRPARPLP